MDNEDGGVAERAGELNHSRLSYVAAVLVLGLATLLSDLTASSLGRCDGASCPVSERCSPLPLF